MANYLKGIGDATNRINEIIPRFDAQILNFLAQCSPGICFSEANKFALSNADRGVNIGPGLCQAYGYFGMSDTTTKVDVIFPTGASQYMRVYAEINLSVTPHRFTIKGTAQSSSSNISLVQHNLSTTPSGIYQIPLYLLTLYSNSTIGVTDQRPQNTKPENAKYAEDSTRSTNATNLVSNGTIASNVTGVTQASSDNSTKMATTAFVRSAFNAQNTMTYNSTRQLAKQMFWGDGEWGQMTLPNGMMFQWYTSNAQQVTFITPFPSKCIFVGYVGHHGEAYNGTFYTSEISIPYSGISRTGFKWQRNAGQYGKNNRKYFAIGY